MQRPFAITPSVPQLTLDTQRRGEVFFTVSNDLPRAVRARVTVLVGPGGADASWVQASPQELPLEVQGTERVGVKVRVPKTVEPGRFGLRIVVSDMQQPDTVYSESAEIPFSVTTPAERERKPFPWWILLVAGGVLALVALVTAVVMLWPERDPDDYTLAVAATTPEVQISQGHSGTVDLALTRGDRLKSAVEITTGELPEGVTAEPLRIRRKGDGGTLALTVAPDAPLVDPLPVTVTATAGDTTATAEVRVGVVPPPLGLVAAFKATPMSGTVPLEVAFGDESNDAVRWEWDFGDGNSSTEQSPRHTYQEPGTYTVELSVYNDDHEVDIATRPVRAEKPPLIAGFEPSTTRGSAPLEVRFADQSEQATSWRYEFGDGKSATTPNPVHTFGKPGTYTVTLTVTNQDGSDRHTETIRVDRSTLSARITARPSSGPAALRVALQGSTVGGTANQYTWDFGDGSTNRGSGATKTYDFPGTYSVRLTATDEFGNTAVTTQPIRVGAPSRVCGYTGWFSEEGGATGTCPSGRAVAGMHCSGSYCDNKRLYCCSYLPGSDPRAHGRWTTSSISEEGGRNQSYGGLLGAVRCHGGHCDNLFFMWMNPTGVAVQTHQCHWTGWFSEENGGVSHCSGSTFVRGVQCSGSRCDNLRLQCCPVQYTRR